MRTTRKTPHRSRAVAAALAAALLLGGCASASPETAETTEAEVSETRSFEADNGTVEIPTDPQRVVAVGNAVTPVLKLEVEPVGVSQILSPELLGWLSDEEIAIHDEATPVGAASELDFETIAGLEPDLITIILPQHVIEQVDVERLQTIAPTIFIANNALEWKTVNERLADALGKVDIVDEQQSEYDSLVEKIQRDHAEIIDSTAFVAVDRWSSTDEGSFAIVYSLCHAPALEVGLSLPEPAEEMASENLSFERLGDLAEYDAIIYPLGPDGEVKDEFVPVTESNAWQSLPAVTDGFALGVDCIGLDSFDATITYLESLDEALAALDRD